MNTPVTELKARLSAVLRKVKAGHEITVTERGIPIARLVPIASGERRKDRRQELAEQGLLRLGRGRVRKSLLEPPGPAGADFKVVEALLAEREEGR